MTKVDSWLILLLVCAFMGAVCLMEPWVFGDSNTFLGDFVNHEFLNFMGVVVTITLASTANLHIELKKLEKEAGQEFLKKTKLAVRNSAYSLVAALLLSILVVVFKPLLPDTEFATAVMNCVALAIILWGVLVIYDITKLAFKL